MKKSQLALYFGAVAAGSALISGFVTYQIAMKKLGAEFDKRLEEEKLATADFLETERARLKAAKVRYGAAEDAKPATPEEIMPLGKVDYTQYTRKPEHVQPEGDLTQIPKDGGDWLVEIDTDEYMANESEYEQFQLTWHQDGVVTDEMNELVPDYPDRIGVEMPPFGGLSGEDHVAYLRNNKLRHEYEVVRGLEAEEALSPNVNLPEEGSAT